MKSPKEYTLRAPGGIIDVSILRHAVEWLMGAGGGCVAAGPYQDLRLRFHADAAESIPRHLANLLDHEPTAPNVMSSAAALGIGPSTPWLTEGVFRELCTRIDHVAQIPVGICDPQQSLLPRRCGVITFTAATIPSYWHCRLNGIDSCRAIHENEVCRFVEAYQALYDPSADEDGSFIDDACAESAIAYECSAGGLWEADRQLAGMGYEISPNQGWLSIDLIGDLEADVVLELLLQAQKRGIASIHVTPWRTLLMKGVVQEDASTWRRLLGRLNISQSSSQHRCLWLMGEGRDAQRLHARIAEALHSRSLEAPCLPIAVCPKAGQGEAPVQIQRSAQRSTFGIPRYDIAIDNEAARVLGLTSGVWRGLSTTKVVSTCCEVIRAYNNASTNTSAKASQPTETFNTSDTQCSFCRTVYSPEIGDPIAGIGPGTKFDSLPGDWLCPVCEAPKNSYQSVEALG